MTQSVAHVSVIIPCYNAQRWIADTLQSVVQQKAGSLEVILIDDGSTDASADVVRREFPFVRLIQTTNLGPSKARNLGTGLASGTFIQYLDADDLIWDGKLAAQIEVLEKTKADVAYGDWVELVASPDGFFTQGIRHRGAMTTHADLELFGRWWAPPAAYLFRKSIVERVLGGWNESLAVIQDARFVLDCALQGGTFEYCPGLMAGYRRHRSGSVSTTDRPTFLRDCLRNSWEIEHWWRAHCTLDEARLAAVIEVYSMVARSSFEIDKVLFGNACAELERVMPGYLPRNPWHLNLLARLLGYPRAELVASRYRKVKRGLRGALEVGPS